MNDPTRVAAADPQVMLVGERLLDDRAVRSKVGNRRGG